MAEANAAVMLARVEKYAAIAVAKLAKAVAVSCWNHMFSSLAVSVPSLAALVSWYPEDCAVNCDSRRSWAAA